MDSCDIPIEEVLQEHLRTPYRHNTIPSKKADTLLLSELSRLGLNVRLILEVVDILTKAGINIHILDLNIDTLLPDGKENPIAKMLLTVLGLGAELERKNIINRLNSGRQLAIERGVKLGRPVGTGMTDEELLQKYPTVVKRLKKGLSVRDTAPADKVEQTSPSAAQPKNVAAVRFWWTAATLKTISI